jgi:DNA-binding transcriptional LysR family regulator
VRVTTSTVVAHYVLPPMLTTLRREFPGIAIELVSSDSAENLLLREADIAVRMFRPTQLELITRKVAESPLVACAHESYLAQHGTPHNAEELRGHDLIGYDRSELMLRAAKLMGLDATREDFIVRTDSQTAYWELTKAGLGVGFAQALLVENTPGMVALLPGFAPPPLEVWLTTHRELFTSRRIRVIYDRLGETLARALTPPRTADRKSP